MNIAIIEDEFYAAERLKKLLLEIDDNFEIIEIIDSVEDAVDFLKSKPNLDLLFLDIQLSDGLSFEIFKSVTLDIPIIFTTAFDDYALEAFKVNSIDYLLKPVKKKDLKRSLEKLKTLQKKDDSVNLQALVQMMNSRKKEYKERFLIQIGTIMRPIAVDNIAYFYTRNDLVYLITKNGNDYSIDHTLSEIEKELNPKKFFRINRQIVVSYNSIKKIEPYFSNRLFLHLDPKYYDEAIVSKRKVPSFKKWLK